MKDWQKTSKESDLGRGRGWLKQANTPFLPSLPPSLPYIRGIKKKLTQKGKIDNKSISPYQEQAKATVRRHPVCTC